MATGRFLPSRLSKAVPREFGTSTGMTAVQSLSFAQHKSEQNKIVIAKAGYHRGDGILPFVLRDQGRFVRTWSPPIWRHGAIAAYAHTQENGKISLYRVVLSLAGVIYFAQFKQIGI